MIRYTHSFLAIIFSIYFSTQAFAASVERNGQKWEVVNWHELYDSSFKGIFSNTKSAFVGSSIVTTGIILSCSLDYDGFALRAPEGSLIRTIPIFPRSYATIDMPYPTYKVGSSYQPIHDNKALDYNKWKLISGYSVAKSECDRYSVENKRDRDDDRFGNGFLLFGTVERYSDYNAFVVDHIEFAGYGFGFLQALGSFIPDEATVNLIKMLLGR
jgi:hypothetical protein